MAGKQFVFVQALQLNRSKRDQELEQAKARSHAAKVVHRRAKDAERGAEQEAERSYQQRMKHLLGQHEGYYVAPETNRGSAFHQGGIYATGKAESGQTLDDFASSRAELFVEKKPIMSALGIIPTYLSLRKFPSH